MTVDFGLKKAPRMNVASIVRIGSWKPDNLRTEFRELTRWAERRRIRTGRWIFIERDPHRWEACLEIARPAAPDGRIRLRNLPASPVAYVVFDPDQVSSRIVYHGLNDWVRWRKREGQIRHVGPVREVYSADPWSNPEAWKRCEVQFLLRR